MSTFEKAVRNQWRYETSKGVVTTEDLWDMPLTGTFSLDAVARKLHRSIQTEEISFVSPSKTTSNDSEKLDLIKYIICTRQEEANAEVANKIKKQNDQRILSLIQAKEDEQLKGLSIEELKERLG